MINYQSKFDFNLKYLDSTEYELYHKALIEFYDKDSICDISGDSNIVKTNNDGILKIECKKSGYFLKIVDAKYININCELNNIRDKKKVLNANIEKLLITDDIKNIKDSFVKLKDKYIDITKEEDEIKKIFSIQENKINDIESNINEIYYEMMTLFFKRKELFNGISNKKLDYKKKEYIMNFLKSTTKNTIDDSTINNLSSKIKVDKNDTKNWVYWIKTCVKYIYLKLKLQKQYKNKKTLLNKYTLINKYFIINEPSVDKSKNIQVKKGGSFIYPQNDSNENILKEHSDDIISDEEPIHQSGGDIELEEQPEYGISDEEPTHQSGKEIELEEQTEPGVSDEESIHKRGGETELEEHSDDIISDHNQVPEDIDNGTKMGNNIVIGSKTSNIPINRNNSSIDETWNKMGNKKQDYSSFRKLKDIDYKPYNNIISKNIKHEKIVNNNFKKIHIDTSPFTQSKTHSQRLEFPKNDNIKIVKIKASDLVGSY